MRDFFKLILVLIKIYIFCKIIYLLYMTNHYPSEYPIESLTWWIYFLVFDIWLELNLPQTNSDGFEDS